MANPTADYLLGAELMHQHTEGDITSAGSNAGTYVKRAGDAMTGPLQINSGAGTDFSVGTQALVVSAGSQLIGVNNAAPGYPIDARPPVNWPFPTRSDLNGANESPGHVWHGTYSDSSHNIRIHDFESNYTGTPGTLALVIVNMFNGLAGTNVDYKGVSTLRVLNNACFYYGTSTQSLGNMQAFMGQAQMRGAGGTVLKLIAIAGQAQNNFVSSANVGTLMVFDTFSFANSGTLTDGIGYRVDNFSNTGTILGNVYAFKQDDLATNSGTVNGTIFGLYLGLQAVGNYGNTPRGIYQADGSATNYFGGSVGIGTTTPADMLTVNGNVNLSTAGNKLKITTGANASAGTGGLTTGTGTVTTTAVTATSLVFLTDTTNSVTNLGALTVSAINAGTNFVVKSSNTLDSSTFNWFIIN